MKRLLVSCAALVALPSFADLTPMAWHDGDLDVPVDSELTISGASCTNTKLTVSGTLNIDMSSEKTIYYVLSGDLANPSETSIKGSTVTVAPNPGDNAAVNVIKGQFWGRWSNWMYSSLHFGKSDGSESGFGRMVLGGHAGYTQYEHDFNLIYFNAGLKPQNPNDEVIDAITIDHLNALVTYSIYQRCTTPVRITFTNSLGAAAQGQASTLGYGRIQIFYGSNLFALTQPGSDLILRGYGKFGSTASAPIVFDYWSGTQCRLFRTEAQNLKACVRTEGDCDVVFSTGASNGWYPEINATNIVWGHTGDFVIPKTGNAQCGLRTTVSNVLPYGPKTGKVRVLAYDPPNKPMGLDLAGTSQRINGLSLEGGIVLNSTANPGTLVFGAGDTDGAIVAPGGITNRLVYCSKTGSGTLTVTNTPSLVKMAVEAGTLKVASGKNVTVGRLSLAAGATLLVDGVTLTAGDDGIDGTVTCTNGGRFVRTHDAPVDENWRNDSASAVGQFVKTGVGKTVLHHDAAFPVDVEVAGGTLAFAAVGTTNSWLKFVFTKMHNNGSFSLSEMLLMDQAGKRVDGGGSVVTLSSGVGKGTDGSAVTNVENSCAIKDMTPKSIWASDPNWRYAEPAGGYRERSPSALFDGVSWTKLQYATAVSAASPKTFVVRLPTTTTLTYCYDFRNGYSGQGQPSSWTVYASPTGEDGSWAEVDARADVVPPTGTQKFYNDGRHFELLNGAPTAFGLAAGVNVQVDAEATLDCSNVTGGQEISKLTIDWAKGAGTLKGVRLATSGTLYIKKGAARMPYGDLGYAFDAAFASGDLSGWKVVVDGVEKPLVTLVWEDGKLTLRPGGMVILVR